MSVPTTRTLAYSTPGEEGWYKKDILSGWGLRHTTAFVKTTGVMYYAPIQVFMKCTVDAIGVVHDAVGGGNLYVALYDSLNLLPNNRLAVSANTAAVVNQKQFILFSAQVQIERGLYFTAVEVDDENDTYVQGPLIAEQMVNHAMQYYTENLGAYGVPPLVATPAVTNLVADTLTTWLRTVSVP